MNVWLVSASALILALIPCGVVMVRSDAASALAALELAGTATVLALMLIGQGLRLSYLYDVALSLAVLSFPAGLVFAHFLERWL